MSSNSGKNVKYKKQKLSSDVLAEILRSDDEDELVEFINNSFPQNDPGIANNNKRRGKSSSRARENETMQEIDLNGSVAQTSSSGTTYDLSSNGDSIILGDKLPRSTRSRLFTTIGLFVSFFALGIAIAMLGPSLLDLKDQVNSSFQGVSTVFTARSVGYLLGSIVAGWLFDRWNGYFVLATACVVASIALVIIPLTKSFAVLMIVIVCLGLMLGSLDTGGNVLILNLFGKNADAQMQGLHAMFGLGAFVSPLLVGPFLASSPDRIYNSTNTTSTPPLNYTLPPTSSPLNQSTDSPEITNHSSLQWPYVISMLFFIMPIIIFVVAGIKDSKRNQAPKPWENIPSSDQRVFRGFILVLLFLFLFLYVGMEVAIGGLIFSFSFKHGVLKSKSMAAYLTSTFWGSFCVGRFLCIPLSMYVRAYRILVISLIGCGAGACCLVFISTSEQAWLWIGACLLGLSMAAVFPSTMSWAETFMHISGKTASVLVVGASLGEMTIPLVIGTLMERKGPAMFLDAILVVTLMAIVVFILASILSRQQQKEQADGFGIHYRKSTETNHSMFSKGDEIVQLLEDSSEIFSAEN